jgi:hypothetical protein
MTGRHSGVLKILLEATNIFLLGTTVLSIMKLGHLMKILKVLKEAVFAS